MAQQAQQDDTRRGEGWVFAQMVLLAAIALAPRRVPGIPALPDPLQRAGASAGLLIGGVGGAVALAGAVGLGSNLTPLPRPKRGATLVQTGLYGHVRHPIYTGLVLGALGWSFFRGSWLGLLLTAVLGVFFDRKAAREELWLEEAFPEYHSYKRRVRKLLPWVY